MKIMAELFHQKYTAKKKPAKKKKPVKEAAPKTRSNRGY